MVADLRPASSPGALLQPLHLVAVLLGPARVHAQQHLAPSPAPRCRRRRHGLRDSSRSGRPRPTAGIPARAWPRLGPQGRERRLRPRRPMLGIALGLAQLGQGQRVVQLALHARGRLRWRWRGACARASSSGPSRACPRAAGLRPVRSVRRDDAAHCPSQRCLLSRAREDRISPAKASISARMILPLPWARWLTAREHGQSAPCGQAHSTAGSTAAISRCRRCCRWRAPRAALAGPARPAPRPRPAPAGPAAAAARPAGAPAPPRRTA